MFRFNSDCHAKNIYKGRHKPEAVAQWRKSIRNKSKFQVATRPQLRREVNLPNPLENRPNAALEDLFLEEMSSLYLFISTGLKLGIITLMALVYYSALFKELDKTYSTQVATALQQQGLFNSSNQCLAVNSIFDDAVVQALKFKN